MGGFPGQVDGTSSEAGGLVADSHDFGENCSKVKQSESPCEEPHWHTLGRGQEEHITLIVAYKKTLQV